MPAGKVFLLSQISYNMYTSTGFSASVVCCFERVPSLYSGYLWLLCCRKWHYVMSGGFEFPNLPCQFFQCHNKMASTWSILFYLHYCGDISSTVESDKKFALASTGSILFYQNYCVDISSIVEGDKKFAVKDIIVFKSLRITAFENDDTLNNKYLIAVVIVLIFPSNGVWSLPKVRYLLKLGAQNTA